MATVGVIVILCIFFAHCVQASDITFYENARPKGNDNGIKRKVTPRKTCQNVPAELEYKISAVDDPAGICVVFFKGKNCQGADAWLKASRDNLKNTGWNDSILSYAQTDKFPSGRNDDGSQAYTCADYVGNGQAKKTNTPKNFI